MSDAKKTSQFASAIDRLNNSSGNLASSFHELREIAKSPHSSRRQSKPRLGAGAKAQLGMPSLGDSGSLQLSPEGGGSSKSTDWRKQRRRSSLNNSGGNGADNGGSSKSTGSTPRTSSFGSLRDAKRNARNASGSSNRGSSNARFSPKPSPASTAYPQSYIGRGGGGGGSSSGTGSSAKPVIGFNGLPFTPSPSSIKPKVTSKRASAGAMKGFSPPLFGGDSNSSIATKSPGTNSPKPWSSSGSSKQQPKKHAISFQAMSPMAVKKPSVAANFNPNHYGGSYINKGADKAEKKKKPTATPIIADIKIEAKLPNLQEKLKARQRARRISAKATTPNTKFAHDMEDDDQNLPEAVRKFRQREKARLAALDEQQRNAEQKVFAIVCGWYIRAIQYPRLLKEHKVFLEERRKRQERERKENAAALKIQTNWRVVLPRKEFLRLIAIRRRREKNQKRIKEIKKIIKGIPKSIKAEIKEMKKEHSARKKEMKQLLKRDLTDEEKKLEEIHKQGSNMIEYLQEENKKFRELKQKLRKDMKQVDKETAELKQTADELASKFASLRDFAEKKAQSVQKKEIASSKCRNRYLPKYRAELAERSKFCIAEHRVKMLYKTRLYKIVKEIQEKTTDPEMASDAVGLILECEDELKHIPEIPVPPDLVQFM
mmetsp:Transcript_15724/g.44061  ORF Transcript_15724/g.44061 Transcript_15724/m.44061 type:complete len:657 (-) Transcript_15724:72-2042(-)|eukprot:CAMPEP_0119562612 /NCGR_PEP_ID=MMETSP1352-20130426/20999_1 /TAXON_ID=265584 /ORGANISM="Stauroneis constricta, Strain CCMP1120" /LENGTH=656 /DNA_ID=CAMNT_0007611051 /DNA_START=45 /DNA_END=2015 /DNA_ORIENTATION=+